MRVITFFYLFLHAKFGNRLFKEPLKEKKQLPPPYY